MKQPDFFKPDAIVDEERYFFAGDTVIFDSTTCVVVRGLNKEAVKKNDIPKGYPIELMPIRATSTIGNGRGCRAKFQSDDARIWQHPLDAPIKLASAEKEEK